MSESTRVFQFEAAHLLGSVASVNTSRVLIAAENSDLVRTVQVGHLLAIQGNMPTEYLMGIIDSIAHTPATGSSVEVSGNPQPGAAGSEISLSVTLVGTLRPTRGKVVFRRGSDTYPQVHQFCFIVTEENLERFMSLLGSHLPADQRMRLGRYAGEVSADAVADGDRFFQRHAAILGNTGSGKSWAIAMMLERAAALPHANIVVFDIHGEYGPLSKKRGGFAQSFRIAGPGDLTEPDENCLFLPFWLLSRSEVLSMVLDRSDPNAGMHISRYTRHVRDLKGITLEEEGKSEVKSTFTLDSPIPFKLVDLLTRLSVDDTRGGYSKSGPVKGQFEGKLTRFVSALDAKREDRRYGFMFQPPPEAHNYTWLQDQVVRLLEASDYGSGIKIIDFSEVPADVLPIVTAALARLLYDLQFWMRPEKRSAFAIICDEAHLYLGVKEDARDVDKQALRTFENIAKEGRKYGVALVAVTQRPSDMSGTILSQCNNYLVLRLTNPRDQDMVKRLLPDSLAGMMDRLPALDVGEAMLIGDAALLPTRMKLDSPSMAPESETKAFWTEWSERTPDSTAIAEAIETLRSQTRPK